jgi:amino acid adenylation domain-containing protein
LWFLNQLEPDSPVYNVRNALRLRGRLNREVLQKGLDTIVERHEVLRTRFSSVDGKPIQVIHDGGNVQLTAIDLTGHPEEQRKDELDQLLSELTHRAFDLQKDWPLRGALIRLADEEHVLLLVMHHIAYDGWSSDILFRELSALYEAFCQGEGSPLKDLPIQYADYAVWQKEWLEGQELQQQLSYWEKQLKGVTPLQLPTDRPPPAMRGYRGKTETFTLSKELAERLKDLSREQHVTLFMTLLAAFQILLHRYTGQNDIVVGSPIAGRTRVEVEGLIGFFVNTLVLRNDPSGNPTFREFLARVRKNALDAYSHQDAPFDKLVEALQPERDLGRNPFFQVMFQLGNYPTQSVSLRDLNIEEYDFSSDIAKFDLSVGLRDDVRGLTGSIEYRTDLFDPTTIERMVGHFQTLLKGIVSNPEQPISELPLLTEGEKHQLVEWNDTKSDYPRDRCIHELFEEQVERTPGAIAVVFEGQQLSYRELNTRANQLAHYLGNLGVGADVPVGICVERSIEMVVGLLGILKAGGAYVPLDPAYPKERLAFMLEDAQLRALLTQERFLSSIDHQRIACLDRDWQEIARESARNPKCGLKAENLAYVLYTSGSTGKPKGVMIQHRSLVNLCTALNACVYAGESAPLRVSLNASIAFDSSVKQIVQLLNGHALYLVPDEYRGDGQALLNFISQHKLDVLECTPAQVRLLIEAGLIERSEHVARIMLVGGEAIDKSLWMALCRGQRTRVFNVYGPTECTVDSTLCQIQDRFETPVIGRPIANVQVCLLDSHMRTVPIGVSGEIHIGGDGLAKGYLNLPELTAEKFIPDPFSEESGARLYKTGDRARYLPDGNIEFLGRIDQQVKIRGYRIELGEIETVLGQHSSLREAVVLAREDSPGDRRLVAYVVAAAGSAPSVDTLRGFLQQKLPEYMVPSAFMFLDSLPITPNGKLDRKALPPPDQTRPDLDETFVAPRTPVEEALANMWAAVLKVDKVGVHDNFFELGGHSLLATQLISRIRDTFKLDLPLRSLFEAPTIYGLAQRMQELGEKQQVRPGSKITRVAREPYRVQQTK